LIDSVSGAGVDVMMELLETGYGVVVTAAQEEGKVS